MGDVLCCYFDVLVMICALMVLLADIIIETGEN